jgi:hypothetical protein
MTRDESIKKLQKFYVSTREIGCTLAEMQIMSEELGINPRTMPLYEMKLAIKYHDLARDMERDLDEAQQKNFVKRENALLGGV